jgi:hypothetical protein
MFKKLLILDLDHTLIYATMFRCTSIIDYVFRWMALQFIPSFPKANSPANHQPELAMPGLGGEAEKKFIHPATGAAPLAKSTEDPVKSDLSRSRENLSGANSVCRRL